MPVLPCPPRLGEGSTLNPVPAEACNKRNTLTERGPTMPKAGCVEKTRQCNAERGQVLDGQEACMKCSTRFPEALRRAVLCSSANFASILLFETLASAQRLLSGRTFPS